MLVIEAQKRMESGKGYARKLRAAGKIPANLMMKGKAESIEIDPKLLPKVWKAGKECTLSYNNENLSVKIQELAIHPVKRFALHVDFKVI